MTKASRALVDEVGELLADEDRRSQSFIARGIGLAAFVGLIVPLVGLFNRPNDELGLTAKICVAVLFLAGVFLLLTLDEYSAREVPQWLGYVGFTAAAVVFIAFFVAPKPNPPGDWQAIHPERDY